MPKSVFNTLTRAFRVQVSNPYDGYNYLPAIRESVRTKLAAFVGASPDEVAITSNTTEGLNFVVNGLDLAAGDEVLMSNLEHPGHIGPWKLKEKRAGIRIKEVPLSPTARSVDEIVGAFAAAIGPKTKVISISHTVFITGLIMPLKELSRLAHDKGLLILADSAHGIGMLDLDMKALGIDFFASSPYKWLGAPTGVGLLYVRKEALDKVHPTVVSSGWESTTAASKLDPSGQRSDAMLYALDEALGFNNRIGKSRIERRIKVLAARLKQELAKVPGVKVHTPARSLPQRRPDGLLDGRRPRGQARRLSPREVQPGRPDDRQPQGRDLRRPGLDADLRLDQGGRHGRRRGQDAGTATRPERKKVYILRPFVGSLQGRDLA
ncbi:MAG: aminotransferase class V-fold PLP-dependent enzyme [Ignavibacteriales bacterium]|nr:aminotransferase class V-fold PLP-dependent enzyme [Ignavibacteriales bacterium]